MATIYGRVNGMQIQKLVALTREVQLALDEEVLKGHARAEAKLARHRKTGKTTVSVDEGKVDRYLVLENPGGSAMAIEKGHADSGWASGSDGNVKGLRIISDAFGKGRIK